MLDDIEKLQRVLEELNQDKQNSNISNLENEFIEIVNKIKSSINDSIIKDKKLEDKIVILTNLLTEISKKQEKKSSLIKEFQDFLEKK